MERSASVTPSVMPLLMYLRYRVYALLKQQPGTFTRQPARFHVP